LAAAAETMMLFGPGVAEVAMEKRRKARRFMRARPLLGRADGHEKAPSGDRRGC
jgi:hypothetical protein